MMKSRVLQIIISDNFLVGFVYAGVSMCVLIWLLPASIKCQFDGGRLFIEIASSQSKPSVEEKRRNHIMMQKYLT